MPKKPKGFGKFDHLMRRLAKVPPMEVKNVDDYCPTCMGTGEITDPDHPDHPANTHDGADETWCIDCDGSGERKDYEAKQQERSG